MGRINLLKMLYLPKFLYVFRNSPTWIPNSFFAEVDRCVGSSIWEGGTPRLARSTLTLPVRCGGLALPNYRTYYWTAVLVTVRWWYVLSKSNAAVCLEAVVLGSLRELGNLVYRGHRAYDNLPQPTKTTLKTWAVARWGLVSPRSWSPFCPLWGNPNLPHIRTVPDPQIWARHGIKTLRDIITVGAILPFTTLQTKYQLPG